MLVLVDEHVHAVGMLLLHWLRDHLLSICTTLTITFGLYCLQWLRQLSVKNNIVLRSFLSGISFGLSHSISLQTVEDALVLL